MHACIIFVDIKSGRADRWTVKPYSPHGFIRRLIKEINIIRFIS